MRSESIGGLKFECLAVFSALSTQALILVGDEEMKGWGRRYSVCLNNIFMCVIFVQPVGGNSVHGRKQSS